MSITNKLLIALLLAAPATAFAEEAKPEAGEKAGEKEKEPDVDPTKHFNYANFSYSGKDEYGGTFGDGMETAPEGVLHEEEPMSPPFIFMIANFAILMWLLVKYGAPAAKQIAVDRHDQIKSALDEAAKLRDQAKAKLAEYETRLKGLDAEIAKLVDGIRADAEADKARILEQAAAQAAQLKKEAEQRIAAEIALARATLTKEVTAATTAATEKLLKDKVTADDQRGLVTTFIKSVDSGTLRAAGSTNP
jgi:F-type H+-transporting ATPase subunit b